MLNLLTATPNPGAKIQLISMYASFYTFVLHIGDRRLLPIGITIKPSFQVKWANLGGLVDLSEIDGKS